MAENFPKLEKKMGIQIQEALYNQVRETSEVCTKTYYNQIIKITKKYIKKEEFSQQQEKRNIKGKPLKTITDFLSRKEWDDIF